MSQKHTPLWSPELYVLGVPPIWAAWVLLLWLADYRGQYGRWGWPPVWLAARLCLIWRMPAPGGQGQVAGWVAVASGAPDLVLAGWWAGLLPDTAGCRVQGIPKLVSAHW